VKTRMLSLALAAGLAMGAATPAATVAPQYRPAGHVLPMAFNLCRIPFIGWILCPGQ
jgi:hypothetical protein